MGLYGIEGKMNNVIIVDEPDSEVSPLHSDASDTASEPEQEDDLSCDKRSEDELLGNCE